MNRRIFLQGALTTAVAAAAGAGICVHAKDTHDVETTTVPLAIGLSKPMRIVVIGDIHFDPLFEESYIAHVVEKVNALRPDMIFYTGDFITAHADRINVLSDILSFATAPLGCFTVPGNHEHWTGIEHILGSLAERAGIRSLINETIPLPGDDTFYLTGIDSFWSGKPDLTIFSRTPDTSRHLVVVHEPDSFTELTDPRIKLQISGHTHGGQVRLPLYGALVLPHMGKEFETGLFEREGRKLYVNRGIGTLVPHIRINCRPEITVFELS
jgi:predicted MPP superfamily phosphohydrolase